MTEYVYTVRSNKPLSLGTGIGNMPSIGASSYGLTVRDVVQRAESNGAAASEGHKVSMELIERIEQKAPDGLPRGWRRATPAERREDYLKREAALDKAIDEGHLSSREAAEQRAALAEFRGYDRPIGWTPLE